MTTGPKRCRTHKQGTSPASSNHEAVQKLQETTENLENGNDCQNTYPVVSQRGIRRFGPPPDWVGEEPPRGCEIFVAKLPRDILEDELIPVFERHGKIFEIRLMIESQDVNKGFGFVKYCHKEDAEMAIASLNNFEIRPNCRINVVKSVDNNRIFIGNIPKCFSESDVLNQMKNISVGVRKVILYPSINDRTKNRGYGFVEFENHQLAAAARQKHKNSPIVWIGHEIKVDWAEPEPEIDDETMRKVRILYVRNLALQTTEQSLKDLFSSLGANIERVKKLKDYAFIHFASREEAEEAKEKYQGTILDGCRIDISWSKPVANREEYQQRKAASKAMLSGINSPLVSPLGPHSDHVLVGARVRTAAGAQGYSVARPYPPSRPKSETSVNALQQASVIMTNPYLSNIALRNTIEQIGVPSFTPVMYTTDRVSAVEETILAAPADMHCHYGTPPTPLQRIQPWVTPQLMNIIPQIPNGWATQQYVPQQISPPAPSVVQYVIPQGLVLDNQYGAYSCPQIIPGHMMTQIPSISGSNMSIDRT